MPFIMLMTPELAKCSRLAIDRVEPAVLTGWKPTSIRLALVRLSLPAPKSIEVRAPKVSTWPLLVIVSAPADIEPAPPTFRIAPVALVMFAAPVTAEKS